MNTQQQQNVLAALVSASKSLGAAASVIGGSGGAGGAMTVPALYLDFLPPELRDNARDFFAYGVDFLTIAAGGTATADTAIQNDSDFLLCQVVGHVVDPADETTIFQGVTGPALTMQIRDTGSGRQLQSRPLAWQNVVGTAQLPGAFNYPKIVDRASTITTTLVNLTAGGSAQAYRVRMAYMGFKIFGFPMGT